MIGLLQLDNTVSAGGVTNLGFTLTGVLDTNCAYVWSRHQRMATPIAKEVDFDWTLYISLQFIYFTFQTVILGCCLILMGVTWVGVRFWYI